MQPLSPHSMSAALTLLKPAVIFIFSLHNRTSCPQQLRADWLSGPTCPFWILPDHHGNHIINMNRARDCEGRQEVRQRNCSLTHITAAVFKQRVRLSAANTYILISHLFLTPNYYTYADLYAWKPISNHCNQTQFSCNSIGGAVAMALCFNNSLKLQLFIFFMVHFIFIILYHNAVCCNLMWFN